MKSLFVANVHLVQLYSLHRRENALENTEYMLAIGQGNNIGLEYLGTALFWTICPLWLWNGRGRIQT